MTEAEKSQFSAIIGSLCTVFRGDLTELILEGYWLGLHDLSLESVAIAVKRAIRESERMPYASELRKLAGVMTAKDRALQAWDVVHRAVGSIGRYQSVDFDDPLINATVRNIGGWERLCSMPMEEFSIWGRKEFERVYASLMSSGTVAEATAYLPGLAERENTGRGHELPEPVKVVTRLPPHDKRVFRELDDLRAAKCLSEGVKRRDEIAGKLLKAKGGR